MKQSNTLQSFREKNYFYFNLVLFQECPEAQSLVTTVLSGIYSLYMIKFQPFQNKFENNKIILTELLIMFNSMFFPVYQIFSMRGNIEIVEYLGWLNVYQKTKTVEGFQLILAGILLVDLYYQGRILKAILKLLGIQVPTRTGHMIQQIYQ